MNEEPKTTHSAHLSPRDRGEPGKHAERITIVAPGYAARNYWADMWIYRELFAILGWRDISVRYKQTAIGVGWAVLRPLLTMLVFTVLFGRIAKLPPDGSSPYALMVFAGLLPWFLFSTILTEASNSLITNANLVSKVYFPRLIIPVASAVASLVDFAISLGLLGLMMVWYGHLPGWQILLLPAFVALGIVASLGPALLVTALNVKYRDFRYVIPFVVQIGMYISPVGFSSSVVPADWRLLYSLNPIVGVIDGFRWALLGGQSGLYLPGLAVSVAVAVMGLWFGFRYFRATEHSFADII